MQQTSTNPRVTRLLLALTAVEVLVLLAAGGGLFFLPQSLAEIWPWELAPFNTAFLGAVYLASMLSAAMLVYLGRWSPARIVMPMILVFTAVLMVLTLVYLDRFRLPNPFTWIWLALYFVIPLNAAYHLWRYRRWKPVRPQPLSPAWRLVLLGIAAIYGLYGLGLLLAPQPSASIWPWPIDVFHAQIYSVAFLTPALGALMLVRAAGWAEVFTLGLSLSAGGLFPILGLWMVDASARRVDWGAPGTLLWLALFAGFLLAGLGLLWTSRRLPRPAGQLNSGGFTLSPRLVALSLGVAFTAAGIAGFLPAFTPPPPPDAPPLIVHHGYGLLLGLFPVNLIHNLFHLSIGLLGLVLGLRPGTALLYVRGFAVALAALTVAGLLPGFRSAFGLAPLYGHDVWLHGIEALAAGYVGFWMPAEQAQPVELEREGALP